MNKWDNPKNMIICTLFLDLFLWYSKLVFFAIAVWGGKGGRVEYSCEQDLENSQFTETKLDVINA